MTSWQVSGRDVFEAIAKTMIGRPVVGEYALEDMALDLERLLDRLSIRRAHVVGISMGGMIAQVFAAQCPNRAATLTSISSAVGNPRTGFGNLRAIAAVAMTCLLYTSLLRENAAGDCDARIKRFFDADVKPGIDRT